MTEWRHVKIGDVCSIEKGKTGLANAMPGSYPLVATGAERKTSSEYQFDAKAVCIPLVSSTGHGKKSLNYVHYQEGRFALGSILAAVIPNDEKVLNARFLHVYLKKNKDRVLVPLMKGAANVSLSVNAISGIEIPLPSITRQEAILNRIDSIAQEHSDFLSEIDVQSGLLVKLRQAILQEAIEGKLTTEWRKQNLIREENSAAALLIGIRKARENWFKQAKDAAFKEALIIERKINDLENNMPKPPSINLPNEWVWAPVLMVSQLVVDCHNKTAPYVDSGIPLVRTTNVRNGCLDLNNTKFVNEKTYAFWSRRCPPESGDIIFTREAPVGEAAIIPEGAKICLGQRTMLIRLFKDLVLPEYLMIVLTSPDFLSRISKQKKGAMVGHLRVGDVENFYVPVPPFEEQRAIVGRVHELLGVVGELAEQVVLNKTKGEMLMQSVLREAFA